MNDQLSLLASKVLANEASEEEKSTLRQLLSEGDNGFIFMQLKEYWNSSVEVASDTGKKEFESSVQVKLQAIERDRFKKLFSRVASIAAVFFVAACTFAYLFFAQPEGQLLTYSAQSVPTEYRLPDGSTVTLNKNSNVTFPAKFGKKERRVRLIGEGYFSVSQDAGKPFIVETSGTQTEVLGTVFNVKAEEDLVMTTLLEGTIMFHTNHFQVLMKPNETIVYNTVSGEYERGYTDTQLSTAWVSGRFYYYNLAFSDLTDKLEQIYKYSIYMKNSVVASRVVSANFTVEQPIEEVFEALKNEMMFNYQIDHETKKIVIY
ncbi:MAG: FecR family protein [Fermentimonas sp.]|jgi:transmembrane sensor